MRAPKARPKLLSECVEFVSVDAADLDYVLSFDGESSWFNCDGELAGWNSKGALRLSSKNLI